MLRNENSRLDFFKIYHVFLSNTNSDYIEVCVYIIESVLDYLIPVQERQEP